MTGIDVKKIGVPFPEMGYEHYLEYAQPEQQTAARIFSVVLQHPMSESEKQEHAGQVRRSIGVYQWE